MVGYTEDPEIQIRMEDQLVADLEAQNIIAFASHKDVVKITESTPQQVIDVAQAKKSLGIIVINQVSRDASDSIIQNPERISPLHPTLQEFYSYSRNLAGESYTQDQEVFAEVNFFILDHGEAKLFWSGTTWSFNGDNRGAAIRDISSMISQQLVELRDRFR